MCDFYITAPLPSAQTSLLSFPFNHYSRHNTHHDNLITTRCPRSGTQGADIDLRASLCPHKVLTRNTYMRLALSSRQPISRLPSPDPHCSMLRDLEANALDPCRQSLQQDPESDLSQAGGSSGCIQFQDPWSLQQDGTFDGGGKESRRDCLFGRKPCPGCGFCRKDDGDQGHHRDANPYTGDQVPECIKTGIEGDLAWQEL